MTGGWGRRVLVALATTALVGMSGASPAGASIVDTERATLSLGAPRVTPQADRVLVIPGSVTPATVNRSTPVRISGTVTARTGVALSGARLRVVADSTSLTQRSAVASWATSTRPARGRVVAEQALPALAAGHTTTFAVTIPAGRVTSSEVFAALPISIEVSPAAGGAPSGVTHTFLAWHARKEYVPIRLATVMPVTLSPDVDLYSRDAATRSAAWVEHLGPDSSVHGIVAGSAGRSVTLAVDPSVLGPAEVPGPGPADTPTPTPPPTATTASSTTTHSTTAPSGTGQPGGIPSTGTQTSAPTRSTGPTTAPPRPGAADEVTPLVDALVGSLRGRALWALPYADADLAAAVDVDPTNSLVRDLVERASLLGTRVDETVARGILWPVDGTISRARDQGLQTLVAGTDVERVSAVVVSQAAVTAPSVYTPSARRKTARGTLLLGYDDALSAVLPEREDSAALAAQQFLADTLVLLGERPGTERSVLVAAHRGYHPDPRALATFLDTVQGADWIEPIAASSLLEDDGTGPPLAQQTPSPTPAAIAPKPVLTAARLANMAEQRDTLRQVATVLRDGASFEATYRELLDELASARWRGAPTRWTSLSESVDAETNAATSAIKVRSQGVNFLAAHGTLRILVQNGLDYTIDGIRLVLVPGNPRLMTVEQPEPITIGPGAQTTVPVSATALAAGRVEIRAYLTTADGTPIGEPAVMRVSANPLDSTIYWVGAVLVGLVLVAGLIRTIRKGTSRVDEIGDLDELAAEAERIEDGGRG